MASRFAQTSDEESPRQNKTLIRFVTDCLQKFVGSVRSIEGDADGLAYYELYRLHKFL
uniref:Uncharacterized protein n=1 Tax=Magallana gigas TaxID=29159 RepID=K1QJE7_MAGGI